MFEIEVVLNTNYGGFSFDIEMALWLSENRGWKIIPEKEYSYKKDQEYPITTLIDTPWAGDFLHAPHADNIKLRTNKDLIDCVRAIQKLHTNDDWTTRYYSHINNFTIKKVKINLEVENYLDGKEKLNCWISENN